MKPNRTTSILQRAPVILAVTAASYGLAGDNGGKSRRPVTSDSRPRANSPARREAVRGGSPSRH